jgi:hypothetical protein
MSFGFGLAPSSGATSRQGREASFDLKNAVRTAALGQRQGAAPGPQPGLSSART